MPGNRSMTEWTERYEQSHRHPATRLRHTASIPLIAISLLLLLVAVFVDGLWPAALALSVLGWILRFVGHYIEGKPPEFVHDWRFLLVGLRWWLAQVQGHA